MVRESFCSDLTLRTCVLHFCVGLFLALDLVQLTFCLAEVLRHLLLMIYDDVRSLYTTILSMLLLVVILFSSTHMDKIDGLCKRLSENLHEANETLSVLLVFGSGAIPRQKTSPLKSR